MKRLTRKDKRTLSGYYIPTDYSNYHEKEFIKLGQLEDLEEELGIDLITLFKALKDGILVNKGKWWLPRIQLVYMIVEEEYAFVYDSYIYKLKDYGTKWSLRKEDLQDE